MPVTKGALLHRLAERLEQLEARVQELEAARPRKAKPKPAEK